MPDRPRILPIQPELRRAHDVGGLPIGPLSAQEHELFWWERRCDALRLLLGDDKRRLLVADELRRCVEDLMPADHEQLSYYERWSIAISNFCVEKGLFSRDELNARIVQFAKEVGIPDEQIRRG